MRGGCNYFFFGIKGIKNRTQAIRKTMLAANANVSPFFRLDTINKTAQTINSSHPATPYRFSRIFSRSDMK